MSSSKDLRTEQFQIALRNRVIRRALRSKIKLVVLLLVIILVTSKRKLVRDKVKCTHSSLHHTLQWIHGISNQQQVCQQLSSGIKGFIQYIKFSTLFLS